ncbi:hypothetical protein Pla175_36600 [Pirellulimonas nuda]|uniref:Mu-protocadherin-putative cell-suface protein n=1 Tax=Pirellulimonas nuda TaxID=2528009 RepID=A0A518DFM7_9BACT|nr:hypothetical protein [Pirellulimonas nuda]QDU90258.1 hypothetical protein Pla175_36600 [Pirellulimonas nuda]
MGDRPGIGDRPGTGDRPGAGNRPDWIDRPGVGPGRPGVGDRPIHNRPGWANIDNSTNVNINNRWNNAVWGNGNRNGDWISRHPSRYARNNYWGVGVRNNWNRRWGAAGWFGPNWWSGHYHPIGGWHYHYGLGRHPWNYWWRRPTFAAFGTWFAWNAPAQVWSQPVYYDYGDGGNVYYQDDSVFIDGQEVCSAVDFAASAMDLATVQPPAGQAAAEAAEWMPLGTFAVSSDEQDDSAGRAMQLAVDKEGVVSGVYYSSDTDAAQTVLGQVDKETQRVAFRIGESEDIVAETGLYNLTKDEAPLLVHFGPDKVEYWLLVRLEEPQDEQ